MFKFLFKALLVCLVFGGIGLVGFAYIGDLSPDQTRVSEPVILRIGGDG